MTDKMQQLTDAAAHAPGLKMGLTATGAGPVAALNNAAPDWFTLAGLVIGGVGVLVSLGSLYLGYRNMVENRRKNDLKERELDLHEGM